MGPSRCAEATARYAACARGISLRDRRQQHSLTPIYRACRISPARWLHSGDFKTPSIGRAARRLVLGTGTSGHDVAQELHAQRRRRHHDPAQPDLCRQPEGSAERLRDLFGRHSVRRLRPAGDLVPYPVLQRSYQLRPPRARGRQGVLEALDGARLPPDFGEDDTGFQMMYLRRGGGYYFNVGCSELIIDGKIGLLQYADIEPFVAGRRAAAATAAWCRPSCWCSRPATRTSRTPCARYLGDAIADRIGPVWGFDEGGELRDMWRRTAQPGLWFTAGSLAQCRIFSRYLALQIKALEVGLTAISLRWRSRPQQRVPADADRTARRDKTTTRRSARPGDARPASRGRARSAAPAHARRRLPPPARRCADAG